MADYLTRPVFPFDINWSETPVESFAYDLSDRVIGATHVADPVKSHTARGFEFTVTLHDHDEIADFEEWSDDLRGRCDGFWIPSPFDAARIVGPFDTQSYFIAAQNAETVFGDHPGVHVVFAKSGETDIHAKVDFVYDQRNGQEVVQLTADIGTSLDDTWTVRPLLYVRFAGDEEDAEFLSDAVQHRKLRVVELPTEYSELETGTRPVWLYRFWFTSAEWHFTSLDENIVSNGDIYTSQPIHHSSHQRSALADRDTIMIESWNDTTNPLSRFIPFTLATTLWVEIAETTYATPDTTSIIFTGKVVSVNASGKALTAECVSMLDVLGRRVPSVSIQGRCNWFLFSAPCGLDFGDWQITTTIRKINGPYIDVDVWPVADQPFSEAYNTTTISDTDNLFRHGWLECGADEEFEIRQIVRSSIPSSGRVTISLNAPLVFASVGDSVVLRPGCDGTVAMCKAPYNNFNNWGGHVVVTENLSVRAVETPQDASKK